MEYRMRRWYMLFVILSLYNAITIADNQDDDSGRFSGITVIANPRDGVIKLRWLPNSEELWKITNVSGFIIERHTIVRNGKILEQSEKTILTSVPLKALALDEWQTPALNSPMAAIIAQALYGDTFETSEEDTKGIASLVNQSVELKQRYVYSLLAAEIDFDASCLAGWGFVDDNVRKDESYLYRVFPADSSYSNEENTGVCFTGLDTEIELPKPAYFTADWNDKFVILSWNHELLSRVYNAYYIEKSVDGNNFNRISDLPIINIGDNKIMIYSDSLSDNSATYYYRISGVDSFGDTGPYSDVVSGNGASLNPFFPENIVSEYDGKGNVNISWNFPDEANELIHGFELRSGTSDKGPFKTVVDGIGAQSRTVTYNNPDCTSYFVVASVSKNGNDALSFPILVQPIDSIPPSRPSGLYADIDSSGVVRLQWLNNTEKDLVGYRIFRSLSNGGTMFSMNDIAIERNYFVDTVDVRNLNEYVYYQVAALDHRYNQSELSDTLIIEKPRLVPPTSPVISSFDSSHDGIWITWKNSSDKNVVRNRLYRQCLDSTIVIAEFDNLSITDYKDKSAEYGFLYKYMMTSENRWGVESELSPVVSVRAKTESKLKILSFVVSKDSENKQVILSWGLSNSMLVKEVMIYRKVDNGDIRLLSIVKSYETNYIDRFVNIGSAYEYIIRVVPREGRILNGKAMGVIF